MMGDGKPDPSLNSLCECQTALVRVGPKLALVCGGEAWARQVGVHGLGREWFNKESVFRAARGAHFQPFSICTLSLQ